MKDLIIIFDDKFEDCDYFLVSRNTSSVFVAGLAIYEKTPRTWRHKLH